MKTILLTGATGAVGEAAARAIAARGNVNLLIAGRDRKKITQLVSSLSGPQATVEGVEMDLADPRSVSAAAGALGKRLRSLDALVNVAAVYKAQRATNPRGWEAMFATNHMGPFTLTSTLLPLLKSTPGSKVVTVSAPSSTHLNFEDLHYEKKYSSLNAFGASKMMNLLFTFKLADQFKGSPHASFAFHPGLVKSDLLKEGSAFVRGLFRLISSPPKKSGEALAKLVLEGDVKSQNGKFYNNSLKEMKAAGYAYGEQVQQKLWSLSESLLQESK
jgi:NAD(P)-dependent dehydrogenase (short-subunit alcohol dehydrogenase family)